MQPGRFLNITEVSEILGVTASQVYALVRNGELPSIKVGQKGHWRIERTVLEKYIADLYERTAEYVKNNPLNVREHADEPHFD